MIVTCQHCQKSFGVRPAKLKVGKGRYCSKACYDRAQTTRRIVQTCLQCGAAFETQAYYVERGQMRYCSQACATPGRTRPEAERFWEKVDKRDPDECWPWMGALSDFGHGVFTAIHEDGSRSNISAHVYAWESVNGPMPQGKQGNHIRECRMRSCCNFSHIYPGTKKDNTADAIAAGTLRELLTPERTQGEKNVKAKLTEHDIRAIRASKNNSANTLAEFYGVSPSTIRAIRRGDTWKHI